MVIYLVKDGKSTKDLPSLKNTRYHSGYLRSCSSADFEVIEIVNDSNLYPTLLGINWEFDNMGITSLKKRQMIFEGNTMIVIVPLEPSRGVRYIEPVKEEYCATDIDNIYQMITKEHDCLNPTIEGKLSWECDSSCTQDSE